MKKAGMATLAASAVFFLSCLGALADDADAISTGKNDFEIYCAACHGLDGKGNGPVASVLIRKPHDLTRLADKNGGRFPTDRVIWIIDGRGDVAAHGSREMPVWGHRFGGTKASLNNRDLQKRIANIAAYLETIQE